MCSSSITKNQIFYGLCKKDKIYLLKSIISSTKFYLVYTRRPYRRVARKNVRATFFIFFNVYKMHFKIEVAYAHMSQNTTAKIIL
jgi:hypothetical protein